MIDTSEREDNGEAIRELAERRGEEEEGLFKT
jgi:hypothetical protein